MMHAICGLPRAGTTLLANVLSQNPEIFASSTSALSETLIGQSRFWSQAPEIKSNLAHDAEATRARLRRVSRSVAVEWYADADAAIVFDKGRGWIAMLDLVPDLWPKMRLVCCVRDPREVFASVLRQHERFPLLSDGLPSETTMGRAARMFAGDGIIGGPMIQIEDALRRKSDFVSILVFETFVKHPERELKKIYAECEIDWYGGHDFEHVEGVAEDLDALYLDKFPHDGSGKIEPRPATWPDSVPSDICRTIVDSYPGFSKAFGYS